MQLDKQFLRAIIQLHTLFKPVIILLKTELIFQSILPLLICEVSIKHIDHLTNQLDH